MRFHASTERFSVKKNQFLFEKFLIGISEGYETSRNLFFGIDLWEDVHTKLSLKNISFYVFHMPENTKNSLFKLRKHRSRVYGKSKKRIEFRLS